MRELHRTLICVHVQCFCYVNTECCVSCRARATADAVTDEVRKNGVDLVLHVGDISYANGDPEVTALCDGTYCCSNCLNDMTVYQHGACLWSGSVWLECPSTF